MAGWLFGGMTDCCFARLRCDDGVDVDDDEDEDEDDDDYDAWFYANKVFVCQSECGWVCVCVWMCCGGFLNTKQGKYQQISNCVYVRLCVCKPLCLDE